jgi:haloalkane dehalogenase
MISKHQQSGATALRKEYVDILDRRMAHVGVGAGDPIVFLHGNPTSSYIWRNVLPHSASFARCLAPDLIGMGDSDKLPDSGPDRYTFVEHRRYLDAWFEKLGLTSNVTLVLHDWGSALGFDWARRHPQAVKGIAHMESIVAPFRWDSMPPAVVGAFRSFRSPEGEKLVLKDNFFVESVIPAGILRTLSYEEMSEYRRPFAKAGEGRRPMLTWARQVPIDGEPADVTEVVMTYGTWLRENKVPKLFVRAQPGMIINDEFRAFCRTFPNQQEVTVPGSHFLQEDSPDEIGRAIADWYGRLSN